MSSTQMVEFQYLTGLTRSIFRNARPNDVAIVLPQSLQLSVFNELALEAQQRCVRALYHQARASAEAVGEYQIGLLGKSRLILLPSPGALRPEAWDALLTKVRAGATLRWDWGR